MVISFNKMVICLCNTKKLYRWKINKIILCLINTLVAQTEFRQNSHEQRLPLPGGWWHWCSLLSSIRASQTCLSASSSGLLPPLCSVWGLCSANRRTSHKPSWDIHEFPQDYLKWRNKWSQNTGYKNPVNVVQVLVKDDYSC